MNTYQINAGGLTWNVGRPGTEQPIMVTVHGKQWPMDAVKATSSRGEFLVAHYQFRMWRPGHRPFERDYYLGLNDDGKVLVSAAHLHDVLWGLSTGRSPSELPDCTTATLADQSAQSGPRRQPSAPQRQQEQPTREDTQPAETRANKRGVRQRLARLVRFLDREDGE